MTKKLPRDPFWQIYHMDKIQCSFTVVAVHLELSAQKEE